MSNKYDPKFFLKLLIVAIATALGVLIFASASERTVGARSSGPDGPYTGAPSEFDCTVCHASFPLNSGIGSFRINGLPRTYQANQVIPVTVTIKQSTALIFGFQLTAIDDTGNSVGTLTLTDPVQTQLRNDSGSGNPRVYVEQTSAGNTPSPAGEKTWNFTWTAPNTSAGANVPRRRVTFYAAGNGGNLDHSPVNDYIYTTRSRTGSVKSDFNGDGESDIGVFRPSNGGWYVLDRYDSSLRVNLTFGTAGDIAVPGDYDGDNKTDVAIYRPSTGAWYVLRSSDNTVTGIGWGTTGDVPVPGDYDGDGRNDVAVFRPSTGAWYWIRSSDDNARGVGFGISTDLPVPEDYDGDGITDIAVYRPSTGVWYFLTGPNFAFSAQVFGLPTDVPVAGDYDGDGKADVAVWRPSTGFWYVLRSTNSSLDQHQLGTSTDTPAPLYYDGDSRLDFAVFHTDGTWVTDPTGGGEVSVHFGQNGDVPLTGAPHP